MRLFLFQNVQTDFEARLVSYSVGIGFVSPGVKWPGRDTTKLHLMMGLKWVALFFFFPCTSSWREQGQLYVSIFIIRKLVSGLIFTSKKTIWCSYKHYTTLYYTTLDLWTDYYGNFAKFTGTGGKKDVPYHRNNEYHIIFGRPILT
jgi:hypothetical protein